MILRAAAEAKGPLAEQAIAWSHMPEFALGSWSATLSIADGRAKLREPLVIETDDLRAQLEGSVKLRTPLARSHADLELQVVFSEALIADDERVRFMAATVRKTEAIPPKGRGLAYRLTGPLANLRAIGAGKTPARPAD